MVSWNVYIKMLYTKNSKKRGIPCEAQCKIPVYYKAELVGEYIADIVVDKRIILELKAVANLREEHELQLVNYLKATRIEVGLLLNFGVNAEIKRKIFTKDFHSSKDKTNIDQIKTV